MAHVKSFKKNLSPSYFPSSQFAFQAFPIEILILSPNLAFRPYGTTVSSLGNGKHKRVKSAAEGS